ncbi:hypothetical protein ONV78_24855 [Hahella sp. CR1]|uniref:hypothetical protein n=1 Tax=Hahella sp. CR1 TaxID=2992807 RepID=UPI0024416E0D|nr:hypothetical protein [Hahella sp. CR1]MDG9670994.1 hypothetical protein [Hahella sp. CR1]
MPWMKWLPWRYIISRFARAHGFLDPVAVLSHLHRFSQPSEVTEPIELLRAGAVFHARGFINSRVIQHNLDWVWPYWITRQFDPADPSFVPRAFSLTHVNLTHRNWTAVGLPDLQETPLVDPRGLLTPLWDGWSLDAWIVTADGDILAPSRSTETRQALHTEGLSVVTETEELDMRLRVEAQVVMRDGAPVCLLDMTGNAGRDAWLVLALRPYNPEGVRFIHEVTLNPQRNGWTVDNERQVAFSEPVDRHHVSDYRQGDVYIHLRDAKDQESGECDIGMVTAAAMFAIPAGGARNVQARISLPESGDEKPGDWRESLSECCQLQTSDEQVQFLYDAAVRTLTLLSPGDVYAGPYTYKRFWFRDAAFIIHGLLSLGLTQRAERALDRFPKLQDLNGYFHSQAGEWDSNGEAIWIMQRFCELTGTQPKNTWRDAARSGARWILRKREPNDGAPHAGLLPAGFSAEHLGPNDYYYWDDFWGVAGLRAAASMMDGYDKLAAEEFEREAEVFQQAIDISLHRASERLGRPGMPASPYRRLDAGAIGSVAAGYPLQLCAADDPRLLDTVEFLLANCFYKGGFFQDVIHSGVNIYLTLHVAQVLLRAGDSRYEALMQAAADLASPTGQWPEAVHPATGGGCMGDGQHAWAAVEWILLLRNCFVREEEDRLILVSGVPLRWLEDDQPVTFGPAPTRFGPISLKLIGEGVGASGAGMVRVSWEAEWFDAAPLMEVRLPGVSPIEAPQERNFVDINLEDSR